jgi:hypothetical protein
MEFVSNALFLHAQEQVEAERRRKAEEAEAARRTEEEKARKAEMERRRREEEQEERRLEREERDRNQAEALRKQLGKATCPPPPSPPVLYPDLCIDSALMEISKKKNP